MSRIWLFLAVLILAVAGPVAAVEVEERWAEYRNGEVEVPALLLVPKAPGPILPSFLSMAVLDLTIVCRRKYVV